MGGIAAEVGGLASKVHWKVHWHVASKLHKQIQLLGGAINWRIAPIMDKETWMVQW